MDELRRVHSISEAGLGRPPEPTAERPFAQLEWLFKKRAERAKTRSTKDNYTGALSFYLRHIEATAGRSPFVMRKRWDEFALVRFKEELLDRIDQGELKLASHTIVGYFSGVRQTMLDALAYGLLDAKTLHDVTFGSAFRETEAHESYSETELGAVLSAVSEELRYVLAVVSGYKSTGAGRDPRIEPTRGKRQGYGFLVEDNMRWYFENEMACRPVFATPETRKQHRAFLAAATNHHGGLHKMYQRWGVAALVDENLLMPLAVELIALTGMNPSSLLDLEIDAYVEAHPLTGMPYLRFHKARSGGEKELHLSLLDPRDERQLRRKQAAHVKRCVDAVLSLTAQLRQRLAPDSALRTRLFIYESSGARRHGEILPLTSEQTSAWCARMVKKHQLLSDKGTALQLNLVRFRPTKLTELALEGRDFFEIQQVARHKSVAQTVKYISINRLDAPAKKVVADALERIRGNHEIACARSSTMDNVETRPVTFFKGIVADCKNVFDPPDHIRRTVEYVEGQACTHFNMCLFCRNVVVFKEHLPALAAYRAQIRAAQDSNLQNLPHASHYDQSLAIIDELLDPQSSPFTSEDIEWAIAQGLTSNTIIDPALYRGVAE